MKPLIPLALSVLVLTLLLSTLLIFSPQDQQANLQALVKPADLISYHSADTNQDFTISHRTLTRASIPKLWWLPLPNWN